MYLLFLEFLLFQSKDETFKNIETSFMFGWKLRMICGWGFRKEIKNFDPPPENTVCSFCLSSPPPLEDRRPLCPPEWPPVPPTARQLLHPSQTAGQYLYRPPETSANYKESDKRFCVHV